MSLQVENITVSFAPTNPADITDQKGELNFNATVQTESSTGQSKLTVILSDAEVELYSLKGFSKQTGKFDKRVIPTDNPENTIFTILKANGKLKSRNYKSDNEAKNFIATGMYIPNSRSGTQQFLDTAQKLFQELASIAEKTQVANASNEAAAFVGDGGTDSPDTKTSAPTGEPGAEIPEGSSTPDASSPPVTASDVDGGGGSSSGGGPQSSGDSQINSSFNDKSSASLPGPAASGGPAGGGLFYPQELTQLGQDYMKFITFRYKPEELKIAQSGLATLERNFDNLGSGDGPPIYLPIQGIVDNSTVGWGGDRLNPIQALAFGLGTNLIKGDKKGTEATFEGATDFLKENNQTLSKALTTYMAGKAAGATGLLSRTGGAIVNPNLTLLFNNPELRKFSFTFRLSPRSEGEATMVRQIIRTFKQAMSVRKEKSLFFLLAPNLFKITYHKGGASPDSDHKSIGRAKVCALVACSVNYVPDGSYMTFDDSARTMTSYEMSLSFNEVEPVYYDDYDGLGPDEIGF